MAMRFFAVNVLGISILFTNTERACLFSKTSSENCWLWHRRLSHQNFRDINKLIRQKLVNGLPELRVIQETICPACELGKMKRSSHKVKMDTNCFKPLDMIHMDLCGECKASLERNTFLFSLMSYLGIHGWSSYGPNQMLLTLLSSS